MTIPEILLLITNAFTVARWWFDRQDAKSTLATGKAKADEAVTTLTAALVAKNEELDEDQQEWREKERLMQARINHLESLVYGRRTSQ